MENVTMNILYEELAEIKKRISRVEDILHIPEFTVSEEKQKEYQQTVKNILEGKEGITLAEYKKSRGIK